MMNQFPNPPNNRMVPLCATIDEYSIFRGKLCKVGSCLIPMSPVKKFTTDLPTPPATTMPEVLPKDKNISNNLNHVKAILISSLIEL